MKKGKIITIVVISLLAIIIFIQNTEVERTRLLFLTIEMSRALLLILTFGLGFVTGLIVSFILKRPGKSDPQNQG
jgi:riboflavin transporter FmnP